MLGENAMRFEKRAKGHIGVKCPSGKEMVIKELELRYIQLK